MVSSDLIHDPAIFTHLVGPFNSTAYNSSPKFCPNDYISKDLLLCIAAGKRLEDQFSTKFAEGRAFFSCQNVLLIIFHRTHTQTLACTKTFTPVFPFLSLQHIQAHFVFRQPCARHVLSAFGQPFIVLWSRCHFTLH